jgi:pyridinium-3,5-biscarboxylic acid mononucleotide sulfurtransferase
LGPLANQFLSYADKIQKLRIVLAGLGSKVVACSGGLDSLFLSHFCHVYFPGETLIVHAESPAVPKEAKRRFRHYAKLENWNCRTVRTGECTDEAYLKNPYDRCFICKSHLYGTLSNYRFDPRLRQFYSVPVPERDPEHRCAVLSGANRDDLGEYRPGLLAAEKYGVRHPLIEAGIGKEELRAICRHLGLDFSEIPASPCLSSRIYTATPITEEKLFIIDGLEEALREELNLSVVRCRLKGRRMKVEVPKKDRAKVTAKTLKRLSKEFLAGTSEVESLELDPEPYRPGRAFVTERSVT